MTYHDGSSHCLIILSNHDMGITDCRKLNSINGITSTPNLMKICSTVVELLCVYTWMDGEAVRTCLKSFKGLKIISQSISTFLAITRICKQTWCSVIAKILKLNLRATSARQKVGGPPSPPVSSCPSRRLIRSNGKHGTAFDDTPVRWCLIQSWRTLDLCWAQPSAGSSSLFSAPQVLKIRLRSCMLFETKASYFGDA